MSCVQKGQEGVFEKQKTQRHKRAVKNFGMAIVWLKKESKYHNIILQECIFKLPMGIFVIDNISVKFHEISFFNKKLRLLRD